MSREKILIRTSWVSTIGNAILSASKSLSDYLQAVWLYSVTVLIRQPM